MRKRTVILAAACAIVTLQGTVLATVSINGSYDGDYGAPLALQTNNTQFGDNSNTDGVTANGSELDGIYGVVQNGYLNLFMTGNVETNNNHLNIFIADGRAGQNTMNLLNVGGPGSQMANMNGSKFSPGFNATYALDINGGGTPTTWFANRWDLTQSTAPGTFIGQFNPSNGTQSEFINGTSHSGVLASFDNSNVAGVSGDAGTTTLGADPAAVQTGFELAIPLSQLGSPRNTSLKIMVDINGGGDTFLSNQFLPGLPAGSQNLGNGGKFDFSGTSGMFVTVNVPPGSNVDGIWALTGGGSWGASASWTGGVPALAGDSANFGSLITGASTVTLDGSRTVGQIVFNNANSYTIAAGTGGTLTIDDTGDSSGVSPFISVAAGSHTIAVPVAIANGVAINTVDATGLTVSGVVSGNGPITKTGNGSLVFGANNTYSGDTTVLAGTLQLNTNGGASGGNITLGDVTADGVAAALNLGTAGTNVSNSLTTSVDPPGADNLRTIAATAPGNSTFSGPIFVNGGVVLSAVPGATLSVTNVIQDGSDTSNSTRHNLRIAGGGTVVLSNAVNLVAIGSMETASTSVDSGTLILGSGASLQSTLIDVFTGGVFVDAGGTLPAAPKIYTQGQVKIPGNTGASIGTLSVATLSVDNGGSFAVGQSSSNAAPLVIDAGTVEFIGTPSNGVIDLANNRLRTTNDQNTVLQQLQFGNIITTSAGGTLGYQDTGDGHTLIEFAVGGDADLSGTTDTTDFMTLAQNFNQSGVFWSQGDFNYDGVVNALDFNILASNFGQTIPAPVLGSLVPEPASLSLAALGLVALGRRRRACIAS